MENKLETSNKKFPHRPEIDGMRAIAVLPVLFYHAGLGFPGGYVGVDVFFVISGFLITSLILRDLESGEFSLVGFWERRARRIAPAAIVLVLFVLLTGFFLLLPSDFISVGKSAAMHAAFVGNMYFWKTTSYFSTAADEKPLLHTWSLAVEEQFYLFFPILMMWMYRFPKFRTRRTFLIFFVFACVVSFLISQILVHTAPSSAFYLLPSRAWELLAGAIVAVIPSIGNRMSWFRREIGSILSLMLISVTYLYFDATTTFPGLNAVVPCVGASLLIWFTGSSEPNSIFSVKSILSSRFLVFLGMISYSLYLWHWPLLAYVNYIAIEPLRLEIRWLLVFVSISLAIISWRFVETPFRTRHIGVSRSSIFAWSCGGFLLTALAGLGIVLQGGFPARFGGKMLAIDTAKSEGLSTNFFTASTTLADAVRGKFRRLGGETPAPVSLLVWGDSHARSVLPIIDLLAKEQSVGVLSAWNPGNAPVLGYVDNVGTLGLGVQAPKFNLAVLDFVKENDIPAVLLVARWSLYVNKNDSEFYPKRENAFDRCLINTISELNDVGAKVFVLLEVPHHHAAIPKMLFCKEMFGRNIHDFVTTKGDILKRDEWLVENLSSIQEAGATILDPSISLYDPDSQRYLVEIDGEPLYYDNNHLTRRGAKVLKDVLAPAIAGGQ